MITHPPFISFTTATTLIPNVLWPHVLLANGIRNGNTFLLGRISDAYRASWLLVRLLVILLFQRGDKL